MNVDVRSTGRVWFGKRRSENRALPAPDVSPSLMPYSTTAPLNVTTSNALRVSDAYACVRVLADSIASLPLHVYNGPAPAASPLATAAAPCSFFDARRRDRQASTSSRK